MAFGSSNREHRSLRVPGDCLFVQEIIIDALNNAQCDTSRFRRKLTIVKGLFLMRVEIIVIQRYDTRFPSKKIRQDAKRFTLKDSDDVKTILLVGGHVAEGFENM